MSDNLVDLITFKPIECQTNYKGIEEFFWLVNIPGHGPEAGSFQATCGLVRNYVEHDLMEYNPFLQRHL